jgi:hypothetical protein
MPELLLHVGAKGVCPDKGPMSIKSSNRQVKVEGHIASTTSKLTDSYKIDCPATGTNPKCVEVMSWLNPATRIKINGSPAILKNSRGITIIPGKEIQGLTVLQTRVKGT